MQLGDGDGIDGMSFLSTSKQWIKSKQYMKQIERNLVWFMKPYEALKDKCWRLIKHDQNLQNDSCRQKTHWGLQNRKKTLMNFTTWLEPSIENPGKKPLSLDQIPDVAPTAIGSPTCEFLNGVDLPGRRWTYGNFHREHDDIHHNCLGFPYNFQTMPNGYSSNCNIFHKTS